jgi:hypothetical protein
MLAGVHREGSAELRGGLLWQRFTGSPLAADDFTRWLTSVYRIPLACPLTRMHPLSSGIASRWDLQKACEAALKTIKNLGDAVDTLYRRAEKLK